MSDIKRLSIRISPELYEAIEEARWAARLGQNEFLTRLIDATLKQPRPTRRPKKAEAVEK